MSGWRRYIVVVGEWVGLDIRFGGCLNSSVINEILDFMFQASASIGIMAGMLVKSAMLGWIIPWAIWRLWWWGFQRFEETLAG